MRRNVIEQVFQMVCQAFPRSNAAVLRLRGGILMRRENLPGVPMEENGETKKCAHSFKAGGREYYQITVPLPPLCLLTVSLRAEDYAEIGEPVNMLDTLISAAKVMGEKTGQAKTAPAEENPLLSSLLYADTMEMRIYTFLLAEERGKNLDLPRAVCVIRGIAGRLPEVMETVLQFRKTGEQDICGPVGEESLVLCRCLKEPEKSIRCQCSSYLEELSERIEEKCGFLPEVWVGTRAQQVEEYRCSMEAALAAGECAAYRKKQGRIVYAIDYLLEYTFTNTDPAELKHFLEPYAERLGREPELLATAEALIQNNMNLSMAARQQFVHRNTMMLHASRLWSLLSIDPLRCDRDRYLLMLICSYYRKYH